MTGKDRATEPRPYSGAVLRALRKSNGLTQPDLAMKMREFGKGFKVSATNISQYERGLKPSPTRRVVLAQILGCRPEHLEM